MTPMRANIDGPPDCCDKDQGFHRSLPFLGLVLALESRVM
jgi:hypothetical protein